MSRPHVCAPDVDVGTVFGQLTVTAAYRRADGRTVVDCRCTCGGVKVGKLAAELRSGRCKSCGCLRETRTLKDLLGLRFCKWLVVARAGKGKHPGARWLCRCDCGVEKVVSSQGLLAGGSKSCGCSVVTFLKEHAAKERERTGTRGTGFALVVSQYKTCAANRDLAWSLSEDTVAELTKRNCHYCNGAPKQISSPKKVPWIYNGIDRVDNSVGYVEGNVVPCCSTCNYMKRTMGVETFLTHIAAIYEHSVTQRSYMEMRTA